MRIFLILIFFCFPTFGYEFNSTPFIKKIASNSVKINNFLNKFDESNTLAKNLSSEEVVIKKNINLKESAIVTEKNDKLKIKKIKVSNHNNDDKKIFFSADKILIDNKLNILTAIGNVKLKLDEIELSSEKIIYSQLINEIQAEGNVSLKDENGDFHNGENLIVNNKTLNFQMINIYAQLSDGSQMTARNVSSKNESIIIYEGTKFTPCNCDLNKDETPLWHFSARETRINKLTNTVYHDGVTLHILDLPILYTPTFAHPDWTVKRRTGFLTPSIRVGKETGLTLKQPYYMNKSKSDDFTITPIIFSKSGFLADLEYRKVRNNSNLKANFIGGQVDTFNRNNEDVISGFVSFDSFNEDNWKTEVIFQDSSEDSFLRKYKLTEETILKSSLSTQRLSDESFSSIELYKIGSLSRETKDDNSPLVLPSIKYEKNFPIPYENSYGKLEMSILELNDDEGHDFLRYSNKITAERNFLLPKGSGFIETSLSGNFYDISKNKSDSSNVGNINALNSYISFGWEDYIPTKIFNNQTIIKPIAQTVLINGSDHINYIPNRDAKDYRLDETNLFLPHRPIGNDFILTGGRLDYGITSFINNDNLVNLTGFIGQSMKLWGKNEAELQSLNPNNTVVSDTDYIARLAFQKSKNFSTDWSARLDPQSFEIYESITTITQNLNTFDFSISHASLSDGYIKDTNGAENLNFKFNTKIASDWNLSGLQNYNLHNGNVKLLKTEYGISYSGSLQNCMAIELKYERETKTDPSIAPVTEVGLVFQFKYLGDVIETL